MKTFKQLTTVVEKEGNPFEGKEIKIFVADENGRTYGDIFSECGFTALFFETELQANEYLAK